MTGEDIARFILTDSPKPYLYHYHDLPSARINLNEFATEFISLRESIQQEAASVLCENCRRGDKPERRIEFTWRFSHEWPENYGRGHSLCGADALWDYYSKAK